MNSNVLVHLVPEIIPPVLYDLQLCGDFGVICFDFFIQSLSVLYVLLTELLHICHSD